MTSADPDTAATGRQRDTSKNQINGRASHWPLEQSRKAIHLRKQGKSASQIATVLGVSRNAVIGHLYRLECSEAA